MERKKIELILLVILFLIAFYFWTLPFQKNLVPYGDVDSSTHFTLADYMGQKNKVSYYLPYYIAAGGYIDEGAGKLWYPPQFHLSAAISQIFSGHRVLGILIFHAISNFAIVFTSFLLIRHLYGTTAAFLSSFLLIFSIRDILWYIWGQYPQVLSFAIVPLTVYCFYRYVTNNEKKYYIYFAGIFIAVQFYIHPQSILLSFLILSIFSLLYWVKIKKIPFKILDVFVFIAITFFMILPFYSFPFGSTTIYTGAVSQGFGFHPEHLNSLVHWYGVLKPVGVPSYYYSFSEMHGFLSLGDFKLPWILPFFFIGILFIILRRKIEDLLMISWIIAFYILSHDFVFGLFRAERFIETEAHILYPVAVVGLLGLASLFNFIENFKLYIKYFLIGIFILIAVSINAKYSYSTLNNAYGGILRLTPYEYQATEWINKNVPEDADILIKGTVIYTKKKWMQALSLRHIDWVRSEIAKTHDYVLLDYSDFVLLSQQDSRYRNEIDSLQKWEKDNLINAKLVYDKDFVRVYKLET